MALAAPFAWAVWALLVVVRGQEMVQSDACKDQHSSDEDDAAMLQVDAQSLVSTDGEWKLSPSGGSCDDVCGTGLCDTSKQEQLTDRQIRYGARLLGGYTCRETMSPNSDDGAPGVLASNSQCYRYSGQAGKTTCGATFYSKRRFCYCKDASGGSSGDPHIQSLRGAHYSLLKEGAFLAWSFSKAPVEWQLYAHYAGSTFTTQGLLLLDKSLGRRMEMTAEDCQWRSQEGGKWHAVKSGAQELSWKVQTTNLTSPDLVVMGSEINLSMEVPQGQHKVARLLSHCTPGDHLDFKLTMFKKEDIDYVNGELGVDPQVWNTSSLFYSKSSQMQMRSDLEFEASASWSSLGGSAAAAEYLKKKQQEQAEASLVLRKDCTESEIRAATKTCAKYLKNILNQDVFADCVFDVCHGGGEAEAKRAALLFSG